MKLFGISKRMFKSDKGNMGKLYSFLRQTFTNDHLNTVVPRWDAKEKWNAKEKYPGTSMIYSLTKETWMSLTLITILFLLPVMSNLPERMTYSSLVPFTLNLILSWFTIKNSQRVLENMSVTQHIWTYQTTALFAWFVFRFQVAQGTKKALIDICNFLSLAKSSPKIYREATFQGWNDWLFPHKSADRISGCTDQYYLVVTYVPLSESSCRKNVMWKRWVSGMLFRQFS